MTMTFASALLAATLAGNGNQPAEGWEQIDGIYPHLAMRNYNNEGECGTGAVVPWAGSLWKNGTAAVAYWLWREHFKRID